MNRSQSVLAQLSFSAINRLRLLSASPHLVVKGIARPAMRVAQPIAHKLGARHIVTARSYGRILTMPAEHFLPATLQAFPQFNRPLSLTVEAIATVRPQNSELTVVDVGANIGETVAIIEQHCPKKCWFLCIEPDSDLAELCKANHSNNERVRVEQHYIGEDEGVAVSLVDDGRANPSVCLALEHLTPESVHTRLVRLDTVASSFAGDHGFLSLIKVDTEGYDFSVLRSASVLLTSYKPTIYFEWFPRLLTSLKEEVWGGFEYLGGLGYHYFVFFTSQGDFYCQTSHPDRLFLRSLANVTTRGKGMEYFDVCASTEKMVCETLTELSISEE